MDSQAKIPTLLGLGIILVGTVAGVFLVGKVQVFKSSASPSQEPKSITVVNISANKAAVFWQTDQPIAGFIQAGPSTALGLTFKDERDEALDKHQLHFVTLSNLSPGTTYYFKITSGADTYPRGDPLTFKTAPNSSSSSIQPLIGTVLETPSQPVKEAIALLEIPGAQKIATITKISGNFVLPLADLRSEDLSKNFDLGNISQAATLTIFGPSKKSQIKIKLPAQNNILPPIVLGQDLDLSAQIASPSPTISKNDLSKYDLNHDGVINSLDLAIVINNLGKNPKQKGADLNGDGVVDQKDIDLIEKFIPHIFPR